MGPPEPNAIRLPWQLPKLGWAGLGWAGLGAGVERDKSGGQGPEPHSPRLAMVTVLHQV